MRERLDELDQMAECLKALGHPVRIRILQELGAGKKCVSELSERIGVSQTNLSQHLGLLRSYGWVRKRKRALYVYYSLTNEGIISVLERIHEIIYRL